MEEILIYRETNGQPTSDTWLCNIKGCGFNEDTLCTAIGTECFGYMEVEDD